MPRIAYIMVRTPYFIKDLFAFTAVHYTDIRHSFYRLFRTILRNKYKGGLKVHDFFTDHLEEFYSDLEYETYKDARLYNSLLSILLIDHAVRKQFSNAEMATIREIMLTNTQKMNLQYGGEDNVTKCMRWLAYGAATVSASLFVYKYTDLFACF